MCSSIPREPLDLASFGASSNAAVLGATGGIGGAIADDLAACPAVSTVFRLSRSANGPNAEDIRIDLEDERSIEDAAAAMRRMAGELHVVIVATGVLHDGHGLQPEKTWRTLNASAMEKAFRINSIGPALVAKHLLPLLPTGRKSVFAALSARVGSMGDNQLGGWYAYRSSKAALNMMIRTLSIELARRNPDALCVGLHPGTVDTRLSRPFQSGVPENRLFSPRLSARRLLSVLDNLTAKDTGGLFAWDGSRIPF